MFFLSQLVFIAGMSILFFRFYYLPYKLVIYRERSSFSEEWICQSGKLHPNLQFQRNKNITVLQR